MALLICNNNILTDSNTYMDTKKLIIVIPSYNPDNLLPEVVQKLVSLLEGSDIVLVNDGSTIGLEHFETCRQYEHVAVLHHETNQGKGQALKTAYAYIKKNYSDCVIVTADSDGQHKAEDIRKVYDFFLEHPDSFVLGSRKFDCEVPKNSTLGNNIARNLLRIFLNKYLHDTQTGLRAFGYQLLDFMISLKGKRYEYEMNVLNECVRSGIPINEIAIQTIYIANNKSTHFRPFQDFSRIVFTLLKYTIPLLITFILNTLFCAFSPLGSTLHSFGVTALASLLFYLLLNISGLCFGNRHIFARGKAFARQLLYFALWAGVFYGLISLTGRIVLSVVLSNIFLLVAAGLLNCFWIKKAPLYE